MTKPRLPVSKHMTAFPLIADKSIGIDEALSCMNEYKVRHFPVVEDDQIIGIVSERDFERAPLLAREASHQRLAISASWVTVRQI